MRSLNLNITGISRSLSQSDHVNARGTLRALLLASLIMALAGLANAQSRGRWVGKIEIAPSTTSQAAPRLATSGLDETTAQSADLTIASAVSPSGKKPTIVGSWLLTVNVPGNAPPFDSFKALWCLTGDGLLIASAQGDITPTPFPSATSAYGAWTQTGSRQFAATFVSILYDVQTGENMGSFKLRQSIQLNDAGDEWSGPFKLTVSDPDGNVVAIVDGTAHAKRITVEPLD